MGNLCELPHLQKDGTPNIEEQLKWGVSKELGCCELEGNVRARLWLLLPAVCLFAGDISMTLAGQPATYWAGDYSTAAEYNPIVFPLLARHPALFVAGALLWLGLAAALVLLWRHSLTVWLAMAIALGSALGASTWLARHGAGGWILAVVYLSAAAIISRACWRRALVAHADRLETEAVGPIAVK